MYCPFDRVIIEPFQADEKTPGGIILPGNKDRRQRRGTVISAGPDCKHVAEQDEVVFKEAAGNSDVYYDGIADDDGHTKELVFAKESDILVICNRDVTKECPEAPVDG